MSTYTNSLIKETSPYLLQHAHNPVNWYSWNKNILNTAKKENKLIVISVGYAACHWCHVMEHESFEDKEVAQIMNTHFINIKIDREERPDIDQIYMTAVQMMTGQGGWPLNCVALPDGRPVWGGTYFKKNDWMNSLKQLANLYHENPKKMEDYANELLVGIKQIDIIKPNTTKQEFSKDFLATAIKKWSIYFDDEFGGMNKAPKFPMPTNFHFLLRYAHQTNNEALFKYVDLTLQKMALGGIFDQVEGGFSRYSVDGKWHIPHFEKMLYDNAQLVSLYADAYLLTKNKLYEETVKNTISFVEKEFLDVSNGFYSSLDADSLDEDNQLEEGVYYVFTKEELKQSIPDFDLFTAYYNINSFGYWENGAYHLIRKTDDINFSKKHDLTETELTEKVVIWKNKLKEARSKRPKPRLDDKILTSWNALMLKACCDAYRVFNDEHYLALALKNANFIEQYLQNENGGLLRNYKNGKATINAFLEDYATVIDAYITLYQNTFNEKWLSRAKQLTDYCFDYFFDTQSQLFFYTSNKDAPLISRKIETEDNVIPSSNSIMANNLFLLAHYFGNTYYEKISKKMLHTMATESMQNYPSAYSNWLNLYLNFTTNFYEVALLGEDIQQKKEAINKKYLPNKLLIGTKETSNLPLLQNRYVNGKTMIYVCKEKMCKIPTDNPEEALIQMID